MRRYFITGGTGFIGREIVRQLLQREDTSLIVCLTRGHRKDYLKHPKLVFLEGDITNSVFPEAHWNITHLIHGANEVNDLLQPDQLRYYYTIVEGTNRVLKWAATTGVKTSLVLSSGAVARDTVYGRAKRQCEMIASHYGGDTRIARIFSVLGPEMPLNGQYAIGRFVGMALRDKIVKYYGGDSVRTYLDVVDCASALIGMLGEKPSGAVDIAGENPIRIDELANMVSAIFGVQCKKIEGPDRSDSYLPNSSVKQTLSLSDSLRRIRDVLDVRSANVESGEENGSVRNFHSGANHHTCIDFPHKYTGSR